MKYSLPSGDACLLLLFLIVAAIVSSGPSLAASKTSIQACFSPPIPGECDPAATVTREILGARRSIRVQMYTLTSRDVVTALVDDKRRGVDVRVIIDRSQLQSERSESYAIGRLLSVDIPVLVDTVPGLMHDKILIVDDETVLTGSFNYTWSAENRNAENLIVIHEPAIAAEYVRNWSTSASRSRQVGGQSGFAPPANDSETSAGVV